MYKENESIKSLTVCTIFKTLLFVALMTIGGTSLVQAENAESKGQVYSLGEVLVKGRLSGVEDIAISRDFTFEEIKATNSKTLADALNFVPGITVTRGRKNEPEVSVHGFSQEKTLFLIDGIPYYETYYGKLNLDQIPVNMISKIEITKGAPSVLYGPNAMAAVVNIVTKQGTAKPSLSVTGEIGENQTYRGTFSHGNQVGDFNYWLSYEHAETDGWELSDDFEPRIARKARWWMPDEDGIHEDGGERENADRESDKLWIRAGYVPDEDTELFLSFHTIQSEFGHPPKTDEYRIFTKKGDKPAFSTFARFSQYDDTGIDLSGRQAINDWLTLRGKFFCHFHEDVYDSYAGPEYEEILASSRYKDRIVGGYLIADASFFPWHTGHLSLHYKQDIHEYRDDTYLPYNEDVSYTGSIATEHEFFSTWGLTAVAGASLDWFDVEEAEDYSYDAADNFVGKTDLDTPDRKTEFNPMVGVTYDFWEEAEVYASIAKKTRFPTLRQLYSSRGGNPDLEAETSINYTLGFSKGFGDLAKFEIAGFFHDISDWITDEYRVDPATGDPINANVGEIEMRGVELFAAYSPIKALTLTADYTLNNAKNVTSGAVTDKVPHVAKHKLGFGVDYLFPLVLTRMNVRGLYVDRTYDTVPTTDAPNQEITETDSYFIMNLRVSREFFGFLSAYLEVDNVFDRDYEQEIAFPGRGRSFLFGITAEF